MSTRIIEQPGILGSLGAKIKNLQGSLASACLGPILIIIGFVVLYQGESFKRSSDLVSALPLETASAVENQTGQHKFFGKPTLIKSVIAPEVGEVLYYDYKLQNYREVEEVERETVTDVIDGKEVEKVVERTKLVEKWVDVGNESKWADFKLGGVTVKADKAEGHFDYISKEFRKSSTSSAYTDLGGKTLEPVLGDSRILVNYIPIDSEILVVGDISQNIVASGDTFIVSNLSDAELLASLEQTENATYWILKVVTFFLFLIGIGSLIKPLTAVLDFIPFVGGMLNGVIGVVSAVIAFLLVLMGSLIIKFWWAFLILFVVFVLVIIYLISRKAGQKQTKTK